MVCYQKTENAQKYLGNVVLKKDLHVLQINDARNLTGMTYCGVSTLGLHSTVKSLNLSRNILKQMNPPQLIFASDLTFECCKWKCVLNFGNFSFKLTANFQSEFLSNCHCLWSKCLGDWSECMAIKRQKTLDSLFPLVPRSRKTTQDPQRCSLSSLTPCRVLLLPNKWPLGTQS